MKTIILFYCLCVLEIVSMPYIAHLNSSGCAYAQPAPTTFIAPSFKTDRQVPAANLASAKREVLPGHALSASFFAGGTRLMLSYSGQVVDIWDMQSGMQLQRIDFGDEDFGVACTVITPDGKRIFMGGPRGLFAAWDREHNHRIPDWGGKISTSNDGDAFDSLAVSPDGKLLLLGGFERVELRRVDTGHVLRVLYRTPKPLGGNDLRALAFSPNGKFALIADGNLVLAYNVTTGHIVHHFTIIPQIPQDADVQTYWATLFPDNKRVVY